MEEQTILVCEDSDESIFSAIYEAYERKCDHAHTRIQVGEEENLLLFSNYILLQTDSQKAEKVIHTIKKRFGMETLEIIFEALASPDKERAQAVYQTVVFGLKGNYKGNLIDCIYQDAIAKVVQLSTTIWYELHHLYGFLRFEELENGMLFSTIHPKNRLLPFMGDHFVNRFPNENFVIFDKTYDLCLVHPAGKPYVIVSGELVRENKIPGYSKDERMIQELFTYFCKKISITERENLNLQQQMLPLRFRGDMVEFKKAE